MFLKILILHIFVTISLAYLRQNDRYAIYFLQSWRHTYIAKDPLSPEITTRSSFNATIQVAGQPTELQIQIKNITINELYTRPGLRGIDPPTLFRVATRLQLENPFRAIFSKDGEFLQLVTHADEDPNVISYKKTLVSELMRAQSVVRMLSKSKTFERSKILKEPTIYGDCEVAYSDVTAPEDSFLKVEATYKPQECTASVLGKTEWTEKSLHRTFVTISRTFKTLVQLEKLVELFLGDKKTEMGMKMELVEYKEDKKDEEHIDSLAVIIGSEF